MNQSPRGQSFQKTGKPSINNDIDINSIAFFNAPMHFQMSTEIPKILPPPTNNQMLHLPTPKIPNLNIANPSINHQLSAPNVNYPPSGRGNVTKSRQITSHDPKREM
ncbi:10420_t:CDS:1, partial [Acaulospora morrowiae]